MKRALSIAMLVAACGRAAEPAAPAPPAPAARAAEPAHARCGWIATGDVSGYRTLIAHAAFFNAIHPKWFELAGDGSIRPLSGADDAGVIAAARDHGVTLAPAVASIRDPAPLRAVLRGPERRAAHVAALVALAVERGYAGLDLDYEALWGKADRAAYQAFIDEIAAAMHAAGKMVSVAVPGAVELKPTSPYDLAFLVARVDHVHVMAYDLHTVGTHAGPVAPQGWVEAVAAHAAAAGRPQRIVLGLPNYGVTTTWSGTSRASAARCASGYVTTDDHMEHCPKGRFAAGRVPNCQTPDGRLYFDDLASLEAKVAAARAAGLAGITYWDLGDEPDGFFAMIARYFP